MSEFDRTLGAELKKFRQAAGLTQEALAFELSCCGLTVFRQTTILKIEQGKRFLRLEEACIVANVLGIEVTQLAESAVLAQRSLVTDRRRQRIQEEIANRQQEIEKLQNKLEGRA